MGSFDDYFNTSTFSDADEHWIPKLIDIEYFKEQTDDPNKKAYFSQFGWDALVHSTIVLGSDEDIAEMSSGTPMSVTFGDTENTEYTFNHNFDTFDILFNIRTNTTPSRYVMAQVFAVDENNLKVVLENPPGDDALVILMTPVEAEEGHDPYVEINKRWAILTQRFNQRYYNRMLGHETMEVWQNRLQNRFDQVAARYERAYELYDRYETDFTDDVFEGEKETITEVNQASGSDSNTQSGTDTLAYSGTQANTQSGTDTVSHSSSEWDTPDTAINADASYADKRSSGTDGTTYGKTDTVSFTNRQDSTTYGRKDTATYGRKDTHTITRDKIISGRSILDSANANIRDWMDIDTAFISEFENLFLNVFWY